MILMLLAALAQAAAGMELLQEGKPLKDGALKFGLGNLALKRR